MGGWETKGVGGEKSARESPRGRCQVRCGAGLGTPLILPSLGFTFPFHAGLPIPGFPSSITLFQKKHQTLACALAAEVCNTGPRFLFFRVGEAEG